MKRNRRLRRLVPDPELVRRRAAGETLRALAADYGVAHTTLGRYFARAESVRQLREADQSLRAGRRAAPRRQAAERRAEQAMRRQAKEQAPLGADLRSPNDELAARAVEAGGGVEAVIEATGLRTRENVLRAIDPAILVRAFDNAANAPAPPDRARLRRLVPDPELVRRRAAGETLRRLACDYGVAHTTLGRWFARPEVARQLSELRRRPPTLASGKAHPLAVTVEPLTAPSLRRAGTRSRVAVGTRRDAPADRVESGDSDRGSLARFRQRFVY